MCNYAKNTIFRKFTISISPFFPIISPVCMYVRFHRQNWSLQSHLQWEKYRVSIILCVITFSASWASRYEVSSASSVWIMLDITAVAEIRTAATLS